MFWISNTATVSRLYVLPLTNIVCSTYNYVLHGRSYKDLPVAHARQHRYRSHITHAHTNAHTHLQKHRDVFRLLSSPDTIAIYEWELTCALSNTLFQIRVYIGRMGYDGREHTHPNWQVNTVTRNEIFKKTVMFQISHIETHIGPMSVWPLSI